MFTSHAKNLISAKADLGVSFSQSAALDVSDLRNDALRFASDISATPQGSQNITGDALLESAVREAKQNARENGRPVSRAEVLAIMYTKRDLGLSGYTL